MSINVYKTKDPLSIDGTIDLNTIKSYALKYNIPICNKNDSITIKMEHIQFYYMIREQLNIVDNIYYIGINNTSHDVSIEMRAPTQDPNNQYNVIDTHVIVNKPNDIKEIPLNVMNRSDVATMTFTFTTKPSIIQKIFSQNNDNKNYNNIKYLTLIIIIFVIVYLLYKYFYAK